MEFPRGRGGSNYLVMSEFGGGGGGGAEVGFSITHNKSAPITIRKRRRGEEIAINPVKLPLTLDMEINKRHDY